MAKKRFKAEQIVMMLREAEMQLAKGLDIAQACRNPGISGSTLLGYRGFSILAEKSIKGVLSR